MQGLSHNQFGELRDLYTQVYAPKKNFQIDESSFNEVCNELIEELVEEGYSDVDAILMVEDAAEEFIDEAKVTFGHDTNTRNFYGAPVGAKRRLAKKKAGKALRGAVNTAKNKAAGAAAAANLAVGTAAHGAKRAATKASHAVADAPGKAKAAASDAKKKAKSGIKGFIKRQAQKVVNRMSEEVEALKATGKFSEKEIEAFMEAEMNEGLTGERYKAALKKGKQYSRRVSADPAKRATRGGRGGESDFGAGDRGSGNKAARRAGTYQEENFELWVNGLVEEGYDLSDYTWDEMYEFYLEEVEVEEGYKEIDAKKHGRMYDRYKKLRSAAMQDARDSGEASGTNRMKMGKMSAVIDKSSENLRKKQTRDQLTGRG